MAQQMALDRLGGRNLRVFEGVAEELRQVLTLAEAGIDFSDQEIDELELAALRERLAPIQRFLGEVEGTLERGKRIQEGIQAVLAGLPNAGKSTLFNELLGADRSLISDEAGTTRDVLRELVRIKAPAQATELSFVLHDTAGLRDAAGKVERMGIERTREAVLAADLVLFAVAPGSSRQEVQAEWELLGAPAAKTIWVVTKSDLATEGDRGLEALGAELGAESCVRVSAHRGEGIEELSAEMAKRGTALLGHGVMRGHGGDLILTRPEQQEAVRRARESLERGMQAPGHELLAADLRETLEHLSFFIGKTATDDILGRIFSQFCIGK